MYVVRVVLPREPQGSLPSATPDTTLWLEQFRYAGLVQVHSDDDDGMCFDMMPPSSMDRSVSVWAEHTAKRMQSIGINAVKAPEWKD